MCWLAKVEIDFCSALLLEGEIATDEIENLLVTTLIRLKDCCKYDCLSTMVSVNPSFDDTKYRKKVHACYATVVECSYINLVETTASHGVLHACYAVVECSYINLVGAEVDNCKP